MKIRASLLGAVLPLLAMALAVPNARGAERILLTNGYDMLCDHQRVVAGKLRLYLGADDSSFIDVNRAEVASVAHVDLQASAPAPALESKPAVPDLGTLLAEAGRVHDLDKDLLASVVRAESGGRTHAVSRAGAGGLMQLMPGTAAVLGVKDRFAADQNIQGGAAYLDLMLRRYSDNLVLALAAYNAGPGAVDRWHGMPPYRETRAYVARVIHEYNRRVAARRAASTLTAMAVPRP